MFFRQLLNDDTACASYLFGCKSKAKFAVVDPHVDLVDEYIACAEARGVPIVAVLETHVQADHVSGLPALVERTGATAYLPAGSDVGFDHVALDDGEVVELGNTELRAISTPGHAAAHHAYLVTDHVRGDEPWLVLPGDALRLRAGLRRRPNAGRPSGAATAGRDRRHQSGGSRVESGQVRRSDGPAGTAREPGAVLAARRRHRLRRGDGRAGALDAPPDRGGRLRAWFQRSRPVVHRRLRLREVLHQPRR